MHQYSSQLLLLFTASCKVDGFLQVKEIKLSTRESILHSCLKKRFICDPADDDVPVLDACSPSDQYSLTDGPSLATGFVKASVLVSTGQQSQTVPEEFPSTLKPKTADIFPGVNVCSITKKNSELPDEVKIMNDIRDRELFKEDVNMSDNLGGPIMGGYYNTSHKGAIKADDGTSLGGIVKTKRDTRPDHDGLPLNYSTQ